MGVNKLHKKLLSLWLAINCCWILAWRSLIILLRLQQQKNQREFINRFTRRGAIKMLRVINANYKVTWECPIDWQANENYILMSNHQSYMDLPLIFAIVPTTLRVIAKQELFKIPLFGKAMMQSECVAVDRNNPNNSADIFNQVKKKLNDGVAFLIFPEGTRSNSKELMPFKLGAFRLARETGAKIIPIGISGTNQILAPNSRIITPGLNINIRFGKPIDANQYASIEQQSILLQDVRNAITRLSV